MGMGVLFFLVLGWDVAHANDMARAADYTLLQFTNNSYVHRSFDEMAQMIGADQNDLSNQQCDGMREFQLLTPVLQQNPKGDSLSVMTQQSGQSNFLNIQNGVIVNHRGFPTRGASDPWLNAVSVALKKIVATPEGRALVGALEHARNPIVIKRGVNRFSPQEYDGNQYFGLSMATAVMLFNTKYLSSEMPFYQVGIGGVIYWDPFGKYSRIESDDRVRSIDPFISLAHEMYHAYDSIRGLLDTRFVQGDAYEMVQMGEYRAVYFEDVMRTAYGKLPAKYYSETNPTTAQGKPSLLDANGKPRVMPAPCLQELR